MALRKRMPRLPEMVSTEQEKDLDDIPLSILLQRQRRKKRTPKIILLERANKARAVTTMRLKGTKDSVINEVIERCILEFLPVIPNRLRIETVCKRWRRLSHEEVPLTDLDFSQVAIRPQLRHDVSMMLQRANQQLIRLILPAITLVDAHIELIVRQRNLRFFQAHRMQKKHIFSILKHCLDLKDGFTLELMDCRALTLSRWPHDAAALREMYLHGCNFLTNQAASALIKVCGKSLQKVTLTEAVSLDSQILRDLAVHSVKLVELCISNCNMVRVSDVETFTNALWGSLRSLDLSSCRGISSFPDSTSLPYLQVLILDKTTINDDGLRAIAHVAPSLKYLSLQDCRMISDDGLAAIASSGDPEGCSNLELVDLKGTPVTDASIQTLETQCPELRLVRVDSCRSVSRKTRQKYYERALRMGSGGPVCKLELLFAEKKRREMVNQKTIDSDSDEECEDYQDEDDSAM